jgi:hypothetical protein
MKIFIKKNYSYILSILVVLLLVIRTTYLHIDNHNRYRDYNLSYQTETYTNCLNDSDYYEENQTACDEVITLKEDRWDAYTWFYLIIGNIDWYFPFFTILIVAIPGLLMFHQLMKRSLKNILARQSYATFFKKAYISSLKATLIIPVVLGGLFLYCCYYTNWNFDIASTLQKFDGSFIYNNYTGNAGIGIFTAIFFINIWLMCIFFLNIGYMVDKKSKHFLLTTIGTLLAFFICEIFAEVFGGLIINNLLGWNQLYNSMILTNIWSYEGINNLWIMVLTNLILAIGSLMLVLKLYHKKEEVIIENE